MPQKSVNGGYWQKPPMQRNQIVLLPTTLDDRIPDDHPVRMLDEILDRLDWTDWENTYDRRKGQPPIHPSVLCKILLFAMTRRIRSSRVIEYSINHSIDFMWLASGRSIDHTTISEFRRKHGDQIKDIHRQMIRTAVDMGLAQLAELTIDGSRILADANRYKTWTVRRVEKLLTELDGQITKAMSDLEFQDSIDELFDSGQSADKLPPELADLKARQAKMNDVLDELEQMEARRKKDGIDPRKSPAQLPKTDLDSRILPNKEGGYAPNYTPMCVNETLNGFIVEADVMIGNVEHLCLTAMVDTVAAEHDVNVETVMADSAYPTGENLTAMEDRNVELLSPLAEVVCDDNPAVRDDPTQPVPAADVEKLPKNASSKVFDKQAFVYDEQNDCFHCPAGREMPRAGQENKSRAGGTVLTIIYESADCSGCEMASDCRKNVDSKKGRRVTRDEFEPARTRHRERMNDATNRERYKQRQHFGETPFAVLKACFDLRRFLLRGHAGVQTEFQWACTAFNTKKLIALLAALRAGGQDLAEKLECCGT